jgi:hypothetical protein
LNSFPTQKENENFLFMPSFENGSQGQTTTLHELNHRYLLLKSTILSPTNRFTQSWTRESFLSEIDLVIDPLCPR